MGCHQWAGGIVATPDTTWGGRPATMRLTSDAGREAQLADPPAWTKRAKCIGAWSVYDETSNVGAAQAELLCAGCPVLEMCLAAAMAEEGEVSARHRYGVRGGLTPLGRHKLAFATRVCVKCGASEWGVNGAMATAPRCLQCQRVSDKAARARKRAEGAA